MTEDVTRAVLLPAAEQAELLQLEELENKEQSSSPQLALKCGDSFLVANLHGDFPSSRQETGLFRYGTRFLRTCNLYLEGQSLVTLSHQTSRMGDACHIDLTNAPFTTMSGVAIEQGTIHINRFMQLEQDTLVQTLTITSFHDVPVSLRFSLKVATDFCDLFEVRGMARPAHGEQQPPKCDQASMHLSYCGLDAVERTTHMQVEPPGSSMQPNRIHWLFNLTHGQSIEVRITVKMSESQSENLVTGAATTLWHEQPELSIHTNDPLFNRLLKQGMQDLMMLSTMTPQGYYPYAGIPWFSCPFGRDGLITALEFLPWYPQIARGTLAFLAAHQGTKVEPFTDEEPGKILHEFRTGEMANCREIPYIPYYGSVDATALFLITLDAYLRWTDDRAFLEQIWPHAQAAARWLIDYGDQDGDTFIEYQRAQKTGIQNQGWKDAHDSVSYSDGRIATTPLALCEVQGYAFAAYQAMSTMAQKMQSHDEAVYWEQAATRLQENFLRSFWWEEEQVFYMALDQDKQPCDIVTSNAGQCLWTGIVPEDYAHKIIHRLMRDDMFSGWGIHTLSQQAKRYNPMSYHNGSVWPHDSALVGAGFALYDGKCEAAQILKGLFDASHYFADARLPELYCGFPRRDGYGPTRYPVSCSPQAWAAGAPLILVHALLGLNPHAEEQRLTLLQPTLPDWLNTLEIRGMYVGKQKVHLRFMRVGEHTEVVLGKENEVAVRIL